MKHTLPDDLDPKRAAKDAGLHYTTDENAGITRVKKGKNFSYVNVAGRIIRDAETIRRIEALVIPPAWTHVWISPSPLGHIQATGRDEKGRKQYKYHEKWKALRNKTKFDKLISFGFILPVIRKKVSEDLQERQLTHTKMLATVVRLLDVTHMRIGNEEYAKDNHSYGLTTLLNKHVNVDGATIRFAFRGKSGVAQEIDVQDRHVARIIQQCHDLPGHELFHYVTSDGKKMPVSSEHVNMYIEGIAKEEFTAKDFRTWGGTIRAAESLLHLGESDVASHRKQCLVCAIKDAAAELGNRPATCKKYYIDPRIFEAYEARTLCDVLERYMNEKHAAPNALKPIEKGVHHVLQKASK
jgi:DNA topoisomerase-1